LGTGWAAFGFSSSFFLENEWVFFFFLFLCSSPFSNSNSHSPPSYVDWVGCHVFQSILLSRMVMMMQSCVFSVVFRSAVFMLPFFYLPIVY